MNGSGFLGVASLSSYSLCLGSFSCFFRCRFMGRVVILRRFGCVSSRWWSFIIIVSFSMGTLGLVVVV